VGERIRSAKIGVKVNGQKLCFLPFEMVM
jgi:hypothetical protein